MDRLFAALLCSSLLFLGLAPAQGSQEPAAELRGGWLSEDTIDTAERRAQHIAKFRRARLNTAFLQVAPFNGNYGLSDPAAFEAFLKDAKAEGLAVHAWMQNYKRRGETTPADFTDPAEREAQKKWALDLLAAYPSLDGIHFDYIRTSTWEPCDGAKMQGIAETIRVTREAIRARYPRKFLTCAAFNAAAVSYRGWKPTWQGDVPPWYRDWYAADPSNYYVKKAEEPGADPNWLLGPSFYSYQQDPPAWLKAGFADAALTMQYTAVDATWQNEVQIWKGFLAHQGVSLGGIYMGLGWKGPEPWFEDSKFDPAAMVRFVKYGRSQGIRGFVIFRLGQPGVDDGPLLDALSVDGPANDSSAPFKSSAPSPLAESGAPAPPAPAPPADSGEPGAGDAGDNANGCGATGVEVFLALAAVAAARRR